MKNPPDLLPETLDAHVEAFLDGTLSPADEAAVEAALQRDPAAEAAWQAELLLARRIRDGLHALPRPACPPHVSHSVLAHAAREAPPPWLERFQRWLHNERTARWQPVLAMALLLLLVVSSALVRPAPPAASDEVARARAEVEWTLAFLSNVGRETGQTVRRDVLAARVVEPVQDALAPRRLSPDNQR